MIKLIKVFQFTSKEREVTTLSDSTKIRINAESLNDQRLQLKKIVDEYFLDFDIFAITLLTTPQSIKQWLSFEVIGDFPIGTESFYRLTNGVREIYWDGGTWVTASLTDWNTEQDIRDNISTFPFDNKSIGVVINLRTTDVLQTPKINEIKFLGNFDYNIYQDLLESTMQELHDNLRPISDIISEVITTTNSFDLNNTYKLENKGYNIVDIEAMYDLTNDPLEINNLKDVYTPGILNEDGETNSPGIITTLSSIQAGDIVKIKIIYVPEIAEHTDEDFFEIGKLPSIIFETIEEINKRDAISVKETFSSGGDFIRDIPNKTAIRVLPPAHIDLQIGYAIFTDLSMDQFRLSLEMSKFIQTILKIRSRAIDECFFLNESLNIETDNKGTQGNLMKSKGSFDIRNIPLFIKSVVNEHLVTSVNLGITKQE